VETLERTGADEGAPGQPAASAGKGATPQTARPTKLYVKIAGGFVLALAMIYWAFVEEKIRSTLLTVIIAVAASGGIWIGANLLFNQVRSRWQMFNTIAFAVVGAVLGIVLHGNLVTIGSGSGFLTWVVGPLAGAASFGALGYVLARTDDPQQRRAIALGSSIVIGLVIGAVIRDTYQPGLDPVAIVVYTLVGIVIGAGLSLLLKHPPLGGALIGAALGWVLGAWGAADLGAGSIATSIIAALVPAVLIGLRLGMTKNPDYKARVAIDNRSRAVIFIGPALAFISVMLVIPAIRTAYLSLLNKDSTEFVGADNYKAVFDDKNSLDLANWTNMFTSVPFILGVILLVVALIVGISMKKRTGRAVEIGNPTVAPLVVGLLFVSFGAFTAMRGTLINNLWWVVVVTFVSTAMGLAIAVLADQRGGERVAKSVIFMPMAISLVGASVIWRFVYTARDTSTEQTGVLNALWIGLGRLSTGSGLPTIIATIFLVLVLVGLFMVMARMLVRYGPGRAVVPGIMIVLVGWLFIRFTGIVGGGVGGFQTLPDGTTVGQTVFFVQETPYNNFWLMIVMIWIQTGFSMVILSAAIKAVPTELIEAAKIDGATTSQVFWRVTLPQIATTIGVVVTTLIVGVMKVFDIVKVMTNGQFGSQVLANQMFQEAFSFQNKGKGAALAILIFLAVLPVMIYNIRRMQRES
jgi:alpha-glucoside transport system permease protein